MKRFPAFSVFIIVLLSSLLIAVFPKSPSATAIQNYEIDGDVVYIDDENAYIAVYPHTVNASRYVYLNVTSKKYEGDIDFCFGFDSTISKPKSLELYDPRNVTVDYEKDLSKYFADQAEYKVDYNYTSFSSGIAYDGYVWILQNITIWDSPPETNENATATGWEWRLIYEHFFDFANWTSKTIYWSETHVELWRNLAAHFNFQTVNYDFQGMNKWFLSTASIVKNKEYHCRMWLEIFPRIGSQRTYKYFVAFKPHGESLSQAVANNHLYCLDPWLSGGWDKRVKLTINSTDVDEALTDFPVLVYLSNSTAGENDEDVSFIFDEVGANSQKIAVTTSDGETQCYVEIEKWDSSNEEAWLWVKVPSVSNTSDTDLYLYYDNDHADNTGYIGTLSSATAQNVWDSNFMTVHHLTGGSATDLDDSTSNDNDVSGDNGTPVYNQPGNIGSAVDFERGSSEYLTVPDADTLDNYASGMTLEAWINLESTNEGRALFGKYQTTGNQRAYLFRVNNSTTLEVSFSAAGDTYVHDAFTDASYSTLTWHYVVMVWIADADPKSYVNATLLTCVHWEKSAPGWTASTINNSTENLYLGATLYGTSEYMDGLLDEMRVSDTERSAVWLKASYETQRDHIIDFGSEELANQAPSNEGVTITNMDDTNYLYSLKRNYTFAALYNDTDGPTTIDHAMIAFSDGTNWINATFDQQADSWSLVSGDTVAELATGSCTNTTSGNQLNATFHIVLWWNISDAADIELYQFCNDTDGSSDAWEEKQTDYANIETDLTVSGFACDDDRGDISQTITFTGTVYYEGSSTAPPDDAFTAVHIYDSSNNDEGNDASISNGAFSVAFTAPASVGSDTYNAYIDMSHASAVGTVDAEDSNTDTYIGDNIVVSDKGATDARTNLDEYEQFWFKLRSEHDNTAIQSGTVTLNGSLSATWVAGNSRWEYNTTKSSVQTMVLYVASINWDTYAVTSLSDQTSNTTSISWDNIVVSDKGVTDAHTNLDEYEQYWWKFRSELDNTAVQSGTATLNGSLSLTWSVANTRWEYNISKSAAQTMVLYPASINWDTYTVTSMSSQSSNTSSITWDGLALTGLTSPTYNGDGEIEYKVQITYNLTGSGIDSGVVRLKHANGTELSTDFTANSTGWVTIILDQDNATAGTYTLHGHSEPNYGVNHKTVNETFTFYSLALQARDAASANLPREVTFNLTVSSSDFGGWESSSAAKTLYGPAATYVVDTWWDSHLVDEDESITVSTNTSHNIDTKVRRLSDGSKYVLFSLNNTDLPEIVYISKSELRLYKVSGSGTVELKMDVFNWVETGQPYSITLGAYTYNKAAASWNWNGSTNILRYPVIFASTLDITINWETPSNPSGPAQQPKPVTFGTYFLCAALEPVYASSMVNLTATLFDATAHGIANATVFIYKSWDENIITTTDEYGQFNATLQAPTIEGNYTVELLFLGQGSYVTPPYVFHDACTMSIPLTVVAQPVPPPPDYTFIAGGVGVGLIIVIFIILILREKSLEKKKK